MLMSHDASVAKRDAAISYDVGPVGPWVAND